MNRTGLRLKPRYAFEFCDQTWVPAGARECLFEIMDACNSGGRSYNSRVADQVLEIAEQEGFDTIVELGAGRAPITTLLAQDPRSSGLRLVPCDLTPNEVVYRSLAAEYPEQVQPIYDVVDITEPQPRLDGAVLVMSGMMHHVPFELRPQVLRALSESRSCIAIFEPLKRTASSMCLTLFAFFPAVALPLLFIRQPGLWRRILWCWLLPIVPPMFMWDGLISCLRQWTAGEYRTELERLPGTARKIQVEDGFNSTTVTWLGGTPHYDNLLRAKRA